MTQVEHSGVRSVASRFLNVSGTVDQRGRVWSSTAAFYRSLTRGVLSSDTFLSFYRTCTFEATPRPVRRFNPVVSTASAFLVDMNI